MKNNQIRIRVSSRRGVLPFGSIDTKVDKKHLDKVLVFVLDLMVQDEAAVQTQELSSQQIAADISPEARRNLKAYVDRSVTKKERGDAK